MPEELWTEVRNILQKAGTKTIPKKKKCKKAKWLSDEVLQIAVIEEKRQKDRTLIGELPSLVGAQYATGDQWFKSL